MTDHEGQLSTADIANDLTAEADANLQAADPGEETSDAGDRTPLFDEGHAGDLRSRWQQVQTEFVDDPRQAVQDADGLVAELMKQLARTFADERNALEDQWDRGDKVSTEDLRVTLQRYRSFFDRLLSL